MQPAALVDEEKQTQQKKTTITVILNNLTETSSVCYSLVDYANRTDFANPDAPPSAFAALGCLSVDPVNPRIDLPPVEQGTYALALFVDIDGDEKLTALPFTDTTSGITYQIPLEPIGFSNNAQITPPPNLHVPNFDDCAFPATTEMVEFSVSFMNPQE